MDQDRPALQGLLFAQAAGKLFEGGLEPVVSHLHDPAAADGYNEFVARAALGKALIISAKGGTKDAARAIRFFGYTKTYRRTLRKVRILNALPRSWRGPLIGLYNSLAWRIARKGL